MDVNRTFKEKKATTTLTGLSRRANTKLYQEVTQHCVCVILARNGTPIPCVPVEKFVAVDVLCPDLLRKLRFRQAYEWKMKFDKGWRYAHGNEDGDLPAPNLDGQDFNETFSIGTAQTMAVDDHKKQRFQEYDFVIAMRELCDIRIEGTKIMDDPGALRIVVDEVFQHVFVSFEHYRGIKEGKVTKAEREGKKEIEAFNPWIFVLFKDLHGFNGGDDFAQSNLTEQKNRNGSKQSALYKGNAYPLFRAAAKRRSRAASFTLPARD